MRTVGEGLRRVLFSLVSWARHLKDRVYCSIHYVNRPSILHNGCILERRIRCITTTGVGKGLKYRPFEHTYRGRSAPPKIPETGSDEAPAAGAGGPACPHDPVAPTSRAALSRPFLSEIGSALVPVMLPLYTHALLYCGSWTW